MPEFFVSNIRNSEHLGSIDITLSPVGPNTTSKIVITVQSDEAYPKVGERVTVSLSPVIPEAKAPATPKVPEIPEAKAPVTPEVPVVPEAKAPEVSND